jgi:flagellar protein FlaG
MRQELEAAIEKLNDQVAHSARELGFSVDEETDRLIVRVTKKETGELVRQIPAEAVIRFANSVEDLRGVLFDAEL